MAYLYILKLSDDTHYCGITKDVEKRLFDHALGKSKSTRRKRPINPRYVKQLESMSAARKMEVSIKKHGVTRWILKYNSRTDNILKKIFP
jgi:putative endonuclease